MPSHVPKSIQAQAGKSPSLAGAMISAPDDKQSSRLDFSEVVSPAFVFDFSHIPVHAPRTIQPKLAVGESEDSFEQEADRIADKVMRMIEPRVPSEDKTQASEHVFAPTMLVQTKPVPACGGGVTDVPPAVHEVLNSSGQPLEHATRAFMEPRFGHDFSNVRVHTDAKAIKAAASIGARAFTANHNIVFGAGEYTPRTEVGRSLLSHELTHVVQQQSSVPLADVMGRSNGVRNGNAGAAGHATEEVPTAISISHAHGPTDFAIQRKIVDKAGSEIDLNIVDKAGNKVDLNLAKDVNLGYVVAPVFPKTSSADEQNDAIEIANAMLKTPSGLAALQRWIEMPGFIQLSYTDKKLYDDDGKQVHATSSPTDKVKTTSVKISSAVMKEKDRYTKAGGEQVLGAVAAHESVHQTEDNIAITSQYNALLNEIDKAGDSDGSKTKKAGELWHEREVEPVRLELTTLIEYDILYPDKAQDWETIPFETFLTNNIYAQTVVAAVGGLVAAGYIDPKQEGAIRDIYLNHHKQPPKKK